MHPQFILIVSILTMVMAQIDTDKKTIFSFITDAGVKYWPSDSTKQDIQLVTGSSDFGKTRFKKFDYPVVLATEHSFNLESLFVNGTLDLQNIDIEIDLNFISDFDKKYKPFKDWGNVSTPVTDADINRAINAVLQSGVDVKSVTFDSAKGIRSGFETICALKMVAYVQRWIGSFGGKIKGNIRLLPFGPTTTLNFFSIKMVTLKGTVVRIVADKAIFDLMTDLILAPFFSNVLVNKGSLKLEGYASSPKPTNTGTSSVTPSVGGSNNNAVDGNPTPPSGGAYFNSCMLWIGAITGWLLISL
ncbi:hypothetical protein HDV02_000529 [Globomyces sp. JEL0801]|nr:hypothetical protein HDV02_000529 [Globomyces sp. JEL0801]